MRSSPLAVALAGLLLPLGCRLSVEDIAPVVTCDDQRPCPGGQPCIDGVCASADPDAGDRPEDDAGDESSDAATGGVTDGTAAVDRVTDGVQLLYRLGGGAPGQTVVADQSGVGEPHDLTVADPLAVTWLGDSVRIDTSTIISSAEPATKVIDACVASGEVTVEVFARAADLVQAGPARIATLSLDADLRNVSLMQDAVTFAARLRATEVDLNGTPTVLGGTVRTDVLQHVVFVWRPEGTESLYVDGVEVYAGTRPGSLTTWDPTHRVAIANEHTLDRPWLGEIGLVAVYCRALSGSEVLQNLAAGL